MSMKLRIRGNSIRLRLTRNEVERIAGGEIVEENVDFGPGGKRFGYALQIGDGDRLGAAFDGERIVVNVPRAQAAEWTGTDLVGLEAENNGMLILVEKDFACLTPRRGEDETDMFTNPSPEACAG